MRRTISLSGAAAALAAGLVGINAPAGAFQFENGTIWPIAVGINGGPAQVVPAEEVAFLFRGQCPTGCQVSVAFADPSRAGASVAGSPAVINGNGDQVTVRVRQERGGITMEVVGDVAAALTTPPQPLQPPPGAQTLPPGSQPLQPPPGAQPLQTVPAQPVPQITAPAGNQSTTPAPGFIPPPPPPEYAN
jgi:hypothetical protein